MPQVGDILNGHGNAMPIGTMIRGNVSDRTWEKRDDGWHYIEGGPRPDLTVQPARSGNYTIVRVGPEVTPTTPITSLNQLSDLPVGAVVGRPVNNTRWTKQDDGRWRSVAGSVRHASYFALDGSYHVISTPEFEPVEETSSESERPFPVGHALQDYAEIDRLPVGTVIGPRSDETFTKVREGAVGGGAWHNQHGWVQDFFAEHGHNQVLSYPTTEETAQPSARPNSVTVDGRTFTVGQEVERTADFALLPIGTELLENGRTAHRKTGDREFAHTPGSATISITNFHAYQHHVITALPEEQTSPYQVGLIIDSRELMTGLPEGTVLKVSERHRRSGGYRDARWVVSGDGTYRNQQTGHVGPLSGCRVDSFMQIESLPFTVGQALTQTDYPNLPEGTEVQHGTGGVYRKVGDHMENVANLGTVLAYHLFSDNLYRIVGLPDSGSDSEPSGPFPIGHPLASVEEVSSLPPGTMIGRGGTPQFFIRSDGQVGTVGYENHPGYIHQASAFTSGYCVVSYPEPPSYTVGQQMDDAAWLAVPIRSVVHRGDNELYAYRKDSPTAWTGTGTYSSGTHHYRDLGQSTLVHAPEVYPAHRQTVEEYKQMFRTIVLGAQQANSVDSGPVESALEALGVGHPELMVGIVVDVLDNDLMERLPQGTVLKAGDPQHFASFGVYVKQGSLWTHVLGGAQRFDGLLTVVSIPDVIRLAPWTTTNGTDADQAAIEEFKTRAADLGTKAKRSNSWCGAYEGAMRRAGIDQPITD